MPLSAKERIGSILEEVPDAKARRATHSELLELRRWDEADLGGLLVAEGELAAHDSSPEADRELLTDFAVGVEVT